MADSNIQVQAEIDEIREFVSEYAPGSAVQSAARVEFPEKLFIGLFGRTGCGKTSLINSVKFAVEGKLRRAKWLQVAGQEKAGGHTMIRKYANITKNIFVIDNRGMDKPHLKEAMEELTAQLDGRRGYTEKVKWEDDQDAETDDVSLGDKIATAVFVFSAKHDLSLNITGLEDIVGYLHIYQGRYPVAVITHVDTSELKDVERLQVALRMSGISDIFTVANITDTKKSLEKEYQLNLLNLLDRCMTDGDETIIYKHHQCVELEKLQEAGKQREEARRQAREKEERRRSQEQERQDAEVERRLQSMYRSLQEEKEREIREIMERNRPQAEESSCILL